MSRAALRSKVFWSGGSQALRLPKALRVDAAEVLIRREGRHLLTEPISKKGWTGFWDALVPLSRPVVRHQAIRSRRSPR